jgi:nucleotide-binding universal stress UspA family protein
MMTKQRVLIPLDGSEFSRQILQQVQKLMNSEDNELVLLHVSEHRPKGVLARPTHLIDGDGPGPLPLYTVPEYQSAEDARYEHHPLYDCQEFDSEMDAQLHEVWADKQLLETCGYKVSVAIKFGDPAHEVVEFVKEDGVDLIAMTTHGRSGLSHLLFGSVAEYVMRHVSVPVMMLRPVELPAETFATELTALRHASHA